MVRPKMFYVSSAGLRFGPFSKAEIKAKIDQGKISLTDQICDDVTGEWDMILNNPEFGIREHEVKEVKKSKREKNAGELFLPNDPNKATDFVGSDDRKSLREETTDISISRELKLQTEVDELPPVLFQEVEWLVQQNGKVTGPYSFLAVVSMLQQGILNQMSIVTNSQLRKWKMVSEIPELTSHQQEFKKVEGPAARGVFSRRSHERVSVGKTMMVYDGISFHKVLCLDISQGGMSILVRSSRIKSISTLLVMFDTNLESDQFDAEVKIMSKCDITLPNYDDSFLRYGLKFVRFSDAGKQAHEKLLIAGGESKGASDQENAKEGAKK